MNRNQVWLLTIVGLLILFIGLAYHLKPEQKFNQHYFRSDEKIGYSADGRKWVTDNVSHLAGDGDLVWQIKPDGELLFDKTKSPQLFSMRDSSKIVTKLDSTIIEF